MPSKELKCEFCDKVFRKNELARHVKAKHIKKLVKLILDEYAENPSFNSLKRYAELINPKNNPIYSKVYEHGRYFLGTNPAFFEDEDDGSSYISSDENMKTHNQFLAELVSNISLSDYFKVGQEVIIKSEKHREIQLEKNELEKENKLLKEQVASLEDNKIYLQGIIIDYKEANKCSSTIEDMKNEIKSLKSSRIYYESELDKCKIKYNELLNNQDKEVSLVMEEYNKKIMDVNNQLDNQISINSKLKTELEGTTTKREAIINTRIEKEVKKIKEKYNDKIETFEEELNTLKIENKRLKRNAKKSKSESDSD